jgi:Fe-S cluster assembly protein SufD
MSVELPDLEAPYRAQVELLGKNEPVWLAERRTTALGAWSRLPWPDRPRTPLRSRRLDALPAWDTGHEDPTAPEWSGAGPVMVFNNGRLARFGPGTWAAASDTVGSLRTLATDAALQSRLGALATIDTDRAVALNTALWTDGAYIRIPAGKVLHEPLVVVEWVGGDARAVYPRILIHAEAGSSASVVEVLLGRPDDSDRRLVSAVTEVYVEPSASVRFSSIQELPPGTEAFLHRHATVLADGNLTWYTAEFGAALSIAGHETKLAGPGGRMRSVSVFFGTAAQVQDYRAAVEHIAAHTKSDMLARGVMAGRARSVFTGHSVIRKGAVGSDARQREQTLMLSNGSRADAIPSLVIEDNDVYAAHAATAGPVDPAALYYLESRGLPEAVATRLIVLGFLEPVLSQIEDDTVLDRVRAALDAKLGGLS